MDAKSILLEGYGLRRTNTLSRPRMDAKSILLAGYRLRRTMMSRCSYLIAFITLLPLSSPAAPSLYPSSRRSIGASFVSSLRIDAGHHNAALARQESNAATAARSRCGRAVNGCDGVHPSVTRRIETVGLGGLHSVAPRGGGGADEGGSSKHARGISASLFLTYLTVMGAKCALPSTLALLTSPNSGLAHSSAVLSRQGVMSRLLALSTMSIAAGKLLLGPVIDSLGGILSLQIALSTLFICLSSIGIGALTCPSLTTFAMYWIVVDFAFSSCWAACVKTVRDHLSSNRWSTEIGRLAMAARMGNAISFAFFASLLQWASAKSITRSTSGMQVDSSWRWVFRASGIIQLVPLLMLSYFGRSHKSTNKNQSISASKSTLRQSLLILRQQSSTLEFWLHLISRSIIMVLVSFLLFIPSYMAQCFEMSPASSARVGSAFALGCLLSVSTLAERTYPSVDTNAQRKACFMLGFLALATVCLAAQIAFLQNLVHITPAVGTLTMFLFGFSLAIPFYLPSSMFALNRGGKDGSATIADAFDVCAFGLLAVFNGFVARVLDVKTKQAWATVFTWMFGGSFIAMGSLFGAICLEGRGQAR